MLEHTIHLLWQLFKIDLRLLLSFIKFLFVVLDIFFEIIHLLLATSDHVLFGLECIQGVHVYSKHFCQILHLILVKTARLTWTLFINLLINFHEFRNTFLAHGLIKAVHYRLWEMLLT